MQNERHGKCVYGDFMQCVYVICAGNLHCCSIFDVTVYWVLNCLESYLYHEWHRKITVSDESGLFCWGLLAGILYLQN